MWLTEVFEQFCSEADYARGRLPGRTYVSRSFPLSIRASPDYGQPTRYIHRIFVEKTPEPESPDSEWTNHLISESPAGRKQLQLQVCRDSGLIRQIRIQKTSITSKDTKLEKLLELDRKQSAELVNLIRSLEHIPIDDDHSIRVDDDVLRDIFADPDAIERIYQSRSSEIRSHLQSDTESQDLVALAHRREVIATMEKWLSDETAFSEASTLAGGPEKAWQQLLEANSWILGVGLGGQILTSWDESKLEQRVTGSSIGGVGKTVDALLKTQGIIQSSVFVEIKHQNTTLLAPGDPYRSGCYAPSSDLVGAITQVQQTVHLAVENLGNHLLGKDQNGSDISSGVFLLRPKSYLIIGKLDQLAGSTGLPHQEKFKSFQLYRRNLYEPEVITFDELLEGAKCHVQLAENATNNSDEIQ